MSHDRRHDAAVASSPAAKEPDSKPRVLLVDDTPANLLALEAILDTVDAELIRARSGIEALEQLLRGEFALVLLDVQMPGMDGFELATRIRGRGKTRELPILFLTALQGEPKHLERGYALGAVDYLVKPIASHVLRAKVQALLDFWRRSESLRRRELEIAEVERARLRSQVFESEQQLRMVLDGVRDHAISMLDVHGHVVAMNAPAERIHGYPLAEIQGKHFALFFTPEDRERGAPELEIESARSHGTFSGEGVRRRRDGSIFQAQVTLSALRDEDGRPAGFVKVTYDITERVEASRRAEQLAAELAESEAKYRSMYEIAERERTSAEEANRSKDLFLSVLSHELRTPLNAVLGWARMLRTGALTSPQSAERALYAIERNAQAQAALVEDMLDVSSIHSGKLHLNVDRLDPVVVLDAALDAVRPSAESKHVVLRPSIAGARREIRGDATRIRQVLWNLILNAVKFTPAEGAVDIRLTFGEDDIRIEVADTGEGIDPAFLPHVFGAFRQQDEATTRRHGGLGLGLAIVHHIVLLHGGTIDVSSAGIGKGASFTIRLPG